MPVSISLTINRSAKSAEIQLRKAIWNHNGRGKKTMDAFFSAPGRESSEQIEAAARDGARGYLSSIKQNAENGWIKVLTKPGKDKILGVTIVGTHASDLIAEYILAMKTGTGLNTILGTIHIYPTLAEANKMTAGQWKKDHAPEKLLRWVEKFHNWRRG